jgi:hypothetical protein
MSGSKNGLIARYPTLAVGLTLIDKQNNAAAFIPLKAWASIAVQIQSEDAEYIVPKEVAASLVVPVDPDVVVVPTGQPCDLLANVCERFCDLIHCDLPSQGGADLRPRLLG